MSCTEFKNNELSINEPDTQALIAINAVLREPLFHYKVLTLDAIITIEKDLNDHLESSQEDDE